MWKSTKMSIWNEIYLLVHNTLQTDEFTNLDEIEENIRLALEDIVEVYQEEHI